MYAYSLAFVILPFTAYWYASRKELSMSLSLAYLLTLMMITSHTFYWIQSELPQGMAFMIMFWVLVLSFLKKEKLSFWSVCLGFIFLILVIFSHPLLYFGFLYICAFYLLTDPKNRSVYWKITLVFFLIVVLKSSLLTNLYDDEKIHGTYGRKDALMHFFKITSTRNFIQYCVHDYYMMIIGLIAAIILYVRKRLYKNLMLMGFSFIIYLVTVNIFFRHGADQFYMENQYLILSLIVGFPVAYHVLPSLSSYTSQIIIVSLVVLIGCVRIYQTHFIYHERVTWEKNIISETQHLPHKKLILVGNIPMDTLIMTWGSAYEFALLSSMNGGVTRSIVIQDIPGEFAQWRSSPDQFIAKSMITAYSAINSHYFKMNDYSLYEPYVVK